MYGAKVIITSLKPTYKMTPSFIIWGFPPPIWLPRCWQTGNLPIAPNQTIHIQHQQVLQIRLLCLPMYWVWIQSYIMQWHFPEQIIGHIKNRSFFHFLIHYFPSPFIGGIVSYCIVDINPLEIRESELKCVSWFISKNVCAFLGHGITT